MKMGNQLFSDLPALSDAETSRIADLLAKLVEKPITARTGLKTIDGDWCTAQPW